MSDDPGYIEHETGVTMKTVDGRIEIAVPEGAAGLSPPAALRIAIALSGRALSLIEAE